MLYISYTATRVKTNINVEDNIRIFGEVGNKVKRMMAVIKGM